MGRKSFLNLEKKIDGKNGFLEKSLVKEIQEGYIDINKGKTLAIFG